MSLLDAVLSARGQTSGSQPSSQPQSSSGSSSLLDKVSISRGITTFKPKTTNLKESKKPNLFSKIKDVFSGNKIISPVPDEMIAKPEKTDFFKPFKLPSGNTIRFSEDFDLDTKETSSAKLTDFGKKRFTPEGQAELFKKNQAEIQSRIRPLKEGYKEPGLFGSAVESVKQSTIQIFSGLGASADMIGQMTNQIMLMEVGQKLNLEAEKIIASNPEWSAEPDEKWGAKKVTRLVSGALPSLLGAIASTFVAGPVGAVIYGFGIEGGSTYQEAKKAGKSEGQAQLYGTLVGTVNGYLEKIFPSNLLDKKKIGKEVTEKLSQSLTKTILRKVKSLGVKFIKGGALEGGTEELQKLWSNIIATNYDENRKLWDGLLESFVGGFGSGGIATTIQSGEYTSQEVIDKVVNTPIQDTKEGKELIKVAVKAKESGRKIIVEDKVDTTPLPAEVTTPLEVEEGEPIVGEGITVFRGAKDQVIDVTKANGITGGVSFSTDKAVAERFAKNLKGEVTEYTISKDAKIIKHSEVEGLSKEEVTKFIKENEVDVIEFDVEEGAQGESELRVVNERVLRQKDTRSADEIKTQVLKDKSNLKTEKAPEKIKALEESVKKNEALLKVAEAREAETKKPLKKVIEKKKVEIEKKAKEAPKKDLKKVPKKPKQPLKKAKKEAPKKKKAEEKPIPKGFKESRVVQRVKDTLAETVDLDETLYKTLSLDDVARRSVELVNKKPKLAQDIIDGHATVPEGLTKAGILIASAEQARKAKDYKGQKDLILQRSFMQTRHGQEIVTERLVNDLSSDRFIRDVLKVRMDKVIKKAKKGASKAKAFSDRVATGTKGATKKVRKQALNKIQSAQQLITELTCP